MRKEEEIRMDSNIVVDPIVSLFFKDLRSYNSTNFNTIRNADISANNDPSVNKAFSSIVTRYFIFAEKHPEISTADKRLLFFKLKIDLISKYFSEYPDSCNVDVLRAFQQELIFYYSTSKLEVKGGQDI